MNLAEAIGAALPELPAARISRRNAPRIDPNLIIRDDFQDNEPIVAVYQRGIANFFRFAPAQWQLACLFDGIRSYEEIAAAFNAETGGELSPDEVREFAEGLDESNFWYKTPQEKNLAFSEKLAATRARRAKRKSRFNLTHMLFSAWDPDRFLTTVDRRIGKIVYSQWFTAATLALFFFETVIFILKWGDIGRDTLTYYNFKEKTALDLAAFWVLFLIMGFFHESAHGLTCKHYGGEVHSMGLQLLYLTPAFFVDVTETWISGTKPQRIATILAGIWVETMACGIATLIWWNTPAGDWMHDFAYKIMLITGVAVIVVNLNPLIKLDGYYAFTEILGIADLKERSTGFLSGWVQRNVCRLPVEVPVVPRRRVALFVIYACLSGLYSYLLLFAVLRFSYNVFANWWHGLALLPAVGLAFLMFRGRLRSLAKVLRNMYDHRIAGRLSRLGVPAIIAAALLVLFFLPLWRESVSVDFLLESSRRTAIHAENAGYVVDVPVHEGERVSVGTVIARLRNLRLETEAGFADAESEQARDLARTAQLRQAGLGAALARRHSLSEQVQLLNNELTHLVVRSPIAGTVVTPSPANLVGAYVDRGADLVTIADPSVMRARLYVPEFRIRDVHRGAEAALLPTASSRLLRGTVNAIDSAPSTLPEGLSGPQNLHGVRPPTFFVAHVLLANESGSLKDGMTGLARIYGDRRSLANVFGQKIGSFIRRNVW